MMFISIIYPKAFITQKVKMWCKFIAKPCALIIYIPIFPKTELLAYYCKHNMRSVHVALPELRSLHFSLPLLEKKNQYEL